MKKTLLLVFIHGFKGDDDTFANFPPHLRAIMSNALPNVGVVARTYPRFETVGDLAECVGRFRDWLQNIVIDIEVENKTPSPTVDPSVHVMLVGHSMGGIVAAETIRLLASEQPLPAASSSKSEDEKGEKAGSDLETHTLMFPHIQGLMSFDTPFLGIAPGVVSYQAENHYKNASAAYGAISEVAGVFGWGNKKENTGAKGKNNTPRTLPSAPATSSADDAAAPPPWQRWGRYAMFAGAAGAVAAGGAAALYTQRDKFLTGWNWATSHLEFVGCLARPEELRRRVAALATLHEERGIGCANYYTRLGAGAVDVPDETTANAAAESANRNTGSSSKLSLAQNILRSKIRTFCNLPQDVSDEEGGGASARKGGIQWIEAPNEKASDETKAHISMFSPAEHPRFYEMAEAARDLLVSWVDKGWYNRRSSEHGEKAGSGPQGAEEPKRADSSSNPDDMIALD